jgi:hypothetical protein
MTENINLNPYHEDPQVEERLEDAGQKKPLDSAQVWVLANRLNMPLSLLEEVLGAQELCRQLDQVYPLAQQGDEDAQRLAATLMAELRTRAVNYDNFLRSRRE